MPTIQPSPVGQNVSPSAGRWPPEGNAEAELDFTRYLQALRRAWKALAGAAVVGALLGLGVAMLRPPRYEAATTLSIENSTPLTEAMFRASAQAGTLVAETLHDVGLDQGPHSVTPQSFVSRSLQIEPVAGTRLVKVKVTLEDPGKAAEAARVLSAKAIALSEKLGRNGSDAVSTSLKAQLEASAERLSAAQQQLLKYQNEAQLEVLRKDTDAMLGERGSLLQLDIDIETEKARLASAQEQIKSQQPVLPVPAGARIEAAPARTFQTGSTDASGGDRGFLNPAYQALAGQIAASQTHLAGLERERRELVHVRKLGGTDLPKLKEVYRRQLELARLQTDYDVARQVYAEISLRHEQSKTTAPGVVQVIDPAIPPSDPLPRRRAESAVVGFVGGLLLSFLVTLLIASGRQGSVADRA